MLDLSECRSKKSLVPPGTYRTSLQIYCKTNVAKKNREESLMSASEKFLRFAAECQTMADLARDRESRWVWQGFAARWNRYAQSVELRSAKAHIDRMRRPHRRLALYSSSSGDTLPLTP